jgi:truncated hemoglobin YjbI
VSRGTPDTPPTLFEWAGGYPALLRMTKIFYGQYLPEDPLLAPLFADMSPDHPERVAAWLSEVFEGPGFYTERFGGYDRMVSRHLGRELREEQRARWVQLLCKSADDADIPVDPEFRAAFVSYLEWGSRIAVENSQSEAHPPPHMPGFAFDLWSHDDVADHADAILDRLQAGTMPCDGAWPEERVEVFGRWIDSGKPA